MNIILFGFKNCGKTTIGKLLAGKLTLPFIDTDRLIEDAYYQKNKVKLKVHEIYKTIGEKPFRQLEHEMVLSLKNSTNSVIATGGGCVLLKENANLLKKMGTLVYLKVAKNIIKNRTLTGRLPEFLEAKDPEQSFERMYIEREKIYEQLADLIIEVENDNNNQTLARIVKKLENHLPL